MNTTVKEAPAAAPEQKPKRTYRYDLDGLRGVAIAFVVLFHVFVGRVSGGVDVFLLLSGYFFLGSQLRYAQREDASLNPWWPLWRTIRRLVPLLVTVLAVTVAVIAIVTPQLRQLTLGKQVLASLFYYQNWELAEQGAAYGAASDTTSPLQHLWSMAVQGQFYVFAILLGWVVAAILRDQRHRGVNRVTTAAPIAGPVLILVTAASFLYALYLHGVDQELNYYSTFSRMWELTLGAVLFLYAGKVVLWQWVRAALGAIGLAMVVTTGLIFDGAAVFPGPAALYPLGGAALVILGAGWPARLLASGFARWLGDIAYALYLWHWPLLIISTAYLEDAEPPVWLGIVVIAASLLLADLSHRCIEKPLRQHSKRPKVGERRVRAAATGLRRNYSARLRAAGGVTVALVASGLIGVPASWQASVEEVEEGGLDANDYPGARVLTGAQAPEDVPYAPDPYLLAETVAPAWAAGCMSTFNDPPDELPPDWYTGPDADHCDFGDSTSDITVYLIGGSHAEQWMAPLDALGKEHGFKVVPYVRQSCPAFAQELDGIFTEDCVDFNRVLLERLEDEPPDLVVSTSTRPLRERGEVQDRVPQSYPTLWQFLADLEIPFFGLRDNPWFVDEDGEGEFVSQCLDITDDRTFCGRPRDAVYAPTDPAEPYFDDMDAMRSVDTSEWFCPDGFCAAEMGNIYMWRDDNHMSNDFALSLKDLLWPELEASLPAPAGTAPAPGDA